MRVIKRNICLEELKSRIPALFPYLEFDEFGRAVKHKATDSVDGCYGRIIPDLGEKSYRTLITEYYNGENPIIVDDEDPSKTIYLKDVVGKFDVNLDEYDDSQTLVPACIYAAEAKGLLDKMMKLKKACDASALNATFCCDCKEYKQRGGDKMVEFLQSISKKAEYVAETVFDVFNNDASVRFYVNLSGSIEDLGYYTMAESINCRSMILYSSASKEDVDAPLETPTDKNIPGGDGTQLWFTEDGSEMVWKAELDFDVLCAEKAKKWRITKKPVKINLNGSTDSKLKSMRRYTSYMGFNGTPENPDKDKDWLYFYRKGYVANYETVNDNLGNINIKDGKDRNEDENEYENNLEAYGNILYDIERNTEERTITFTYYINAHLKAKLADVVQDDDGNNLYYYHYPFEYESGGVKQTETYSYEMYGDLDIVTLDDNGEEVENLTDSDFKKLIGDGVGDEMDYAQRTNKKYEFYTTGTTGRYEKTIFDKNVSIEYAYSTFEYEKPDVETDTECYVLFKEDYLMGVHYKPMVSSTVNIQRGNNAAFERHIRLGEVKTLEDMENYQNGSFFNIQETA